LQPFSIAARHAPFWIHLSYDYGGVGARAGRDGPDATGIHFGLGRNSVPQAEPVEARCPLVVEGIEYIPDSGGPGRWRGGLGTRTTFRLLDDADITTRGDRLRFAPPGRVGGGAGRLGGFYRVPAAGDPERLSSKNNNVLFRAGDAFVIETTGGGGLGPPHERAVEAVCRDVAEGKVTAVAAAEQYGVVLADDGAADHAATERRRRQMAGR
jgi:N-methylhydantoinase B